MGNSIEAQTPSQTPDHVIHAAPVAEEHAELKTRNLEATGDELQASGPLVTGFVIPVNGHPIEADADSESSTAVGKPGHKSHTVLIDELIGEADMEAVTLGQIRRQLEQRLGEDYQRRKVGVLNTALRDLTLAPHRSANTDYRRRSKG